MNYLFLIAAIILFFLAKHILWDKPRKEIFQLNRALTDAKQKHFSIQRDLQKQLDEVARLKQELTDANQDRQSFLSIQIDLQNRLNNTSRTSRKNAENAKTLFAENQQLQEENSTLKDSLRALESNLTVTLSSEIQNLKNENSKLKTALQKLESNLTAIPYMAGMISDIETYGLEKLACSLSWGHSQQRLDKVKSIREIRQNARAMVEKNKEAQYQLAYLLNLFPALADVIECDFKYLPIIEVSALSDYDRTRDYLSQAEYATLSIRERNQLALDRYKRSPNKSNWQIGRDYEQYVGYQYRKQGFSVDNFGAYKGLDDLGRDIIAKKDGVTLIVQCKYWSALKQIHEKHITQLYGTMISYCIENQLDKNNVSGVLVTNIQLSETAKKMASFLGIQYVENNAMKDYPCIKCNIGQDEFGRTKIYHLPFDPQYDVTQIKHPGEFYAMTIAEAEASGFRRTRKWFGNK